MSVSDNYSSEFEESLEEEVTDDEAEDFVCDWDTVEDDLDNIGLDVMTAASGEYTKEVVIFEVQLAIDELTDLLAEIELLPEVEYGDE